MKNLILILLCLGILGCTSVSQQPVQMFPRHSIIGTWEAMYAVSGDKSFPIPEEDKMEFSFDRVGHFGATRGGTTIFEDADKGWVQLYNLESGKTMKLIVTSYLDGLSGESMNAEVEFMGRDAIKITKMNVRSGFRMVSLGTLHPNAKGFHFIFNRVTK